MSVAAEYRDDPRVLRFYMRKLLKRGWAGQMTPTESRYAALARRACGKGMTAERIRSLTEAARAARVASLPKTMSCTDASGGERVS